jgi:WD40 repeat protein
MTTAKRCGDEVLRFYIYLFQTNNLNKQLCINEHMVAADDDLLTDEELAVRIQQEEYSSSMVQAVSCEKVFEASYCSSADVHCLALHPILPWIAAGDPEGTIQIWDYEKRCLLYQFQIPKDTKDDDAILSDENKKKQGAASGRGFDIFHWLLDEPTQDATAEDATAEDEYYDVHRTQAFLKAMDFQPSSEETVIAAGGELGVIYLWDYKTGQQVCNLKAHEDQINCLQFGNPIIQHKNRKNWLVSASDDKSVRIWDYRNRCCLLSTMAHPSPVTSAVLDLWTDEQRRQFFPHFPCSPDLLVSSCADGMVRVWDISRVTQEGPEEEEECIEYKPSSYFHKFCSSLLLGSSASHNSCETDLGGAMVMFGLEGHGSPVTSARFHPTLPLLISGDVRGRIKYWRLSPTKAWEVDGNHEHHKTATIACMYLNMVDVLAVSMSNDGEICIYDVSKRKCIHRLNNNNEHYMIGHCHKNLFATASESRLRVFAIHSDEQHNLSSALLV